MERRMKLKSTKVFSVYDLHNENESYRSADCYKINGPFGHQLLHHTKRSIERFGFCICPDIIDKSVAKETNKVLNVLIKKLIAAYDSIEDEFANIDQEELCITRMPRIGRGKHNIHFDPILSPQHEAVAELARQSHFSDILSNYSCETYSLRESGVSLTRPTLNSMKDSIASLQRSSLCAGEGMEWHSDGSAGEATVLLSLNGISEDMGPVRVMPRSHKDYVDGTGHTEEAIAARMEELRNCKIDYVYDAASPLIFDARTLHSVSNNVSEKWRVVIWFIFDCY